MKTLKCSFKNRSLKGYLENQKWLFYDIAGKLLLEPLFLSVYISNRISYRKKKKKKKNQQISILEHSFILFLLQDWRLE